MQKIILVYHGIGHKDPFLEVSFSAFKEQITFLLEHGFIFCSIHDLITSNKNSVSIVFDDGLDTSKQAIDWLESLGLVYNLAIIYNKLNGIGYLNKDYLKSLRLAAFCSHTLNHYDLTKINIDVMKKEIVDSKLELTKFLKQEVDVFVYPRGKVNKIVINEVLKNYKYGLGLLPFHVSKYSNNYHLPRINIHGNLNFWKFKFFLSNIGNIYLHISFIKRRLFGQSYLD